MALAQQEGQEQLTHSRTRQWLTLGAVVLLTGMGAGLGGMLLAMLLHGIQHLAYGYGQDSLTLHDSFLTGVSSASPERRVLVLTLCGLVAGLGWWLLYRFGRPLVSIKKAVMPGAADMPAKSTLVHALLQIVTVALGSPLGREVAPREVGALVGAWLSRKAGLPDATHRLMIACGAGAGLAAVYNVPLGGAIFVLEVLVGSFSWPVAIMALATSAIGACVAWIGLGAEMQYVVPAMPLSSGLLAWALLAGPLFGLAAYGFVRLTSRARATAARGWQLPVLSLLNFILIGCIAVYLPQVLGNGKGPAQLGFDSELGIGLAALLLVVKVLVTSSSLRAGAEGGLLTPGLAIGALMAIILGGAWSLAWPGVPLGAFAIVGAAAFLGASMNMPLTAIVLVAEFTRIEHDFLVPIILAVVGSVCVSRLCEARAAVKR
ncbi:chloride channel protein [Pseudomonas fuscovaginae UPB0736]|uniref:H+/Cl-antiporter ClcA n=1 Tax=Pseudomonas asplenii TaxID=53407 RepID=A0A1H6P0V2_9PSED|nr:chloride channel protein [Pseudomonas fuscovaginae]UUQ64906.1 chloride channel protein [Pseudomonas fuscovaginae UPB0736]SEI20176.1 H+/Cl-antiporter ClcA [Pseudomonas fuscovaginae]